MGQVIRREFVGNWFVFWIQCISIIAIPIAVIHLIQCTVTVVQPVSEPEEYLLHLRDHK